MLAHSLGCLAATSWTATARFGTDRHPTARDRWLTTAHDVLRLGRPPAEPLSEDDDPVGRGRGGRAVGAGGAPSADVGASENFHPTSA